MAQVHTLSTGAAARGTLVLLVILATSASCSAGKACPWLDRCEDQDETSSVSLLQISSSRTNASEQAMTSKKEVKRHLRTSPMAQMKVSYPFYHTSQEIADEMKLLAKGCGGALELHTASDSNTTINVATVRKPGSSPVNKVFILFGEHSRELISPESGLHFLKTLCSALVSSSGKPDTYTKESWLEKVDIPSILDDSEFQMVLNANPVSRAQVEDGAYCLRTNQNGVDLNRNWDEKWEKPIFQGSDTNPGPHPFSEPETRIFRSLVSAYKPTTFVTVHSGTFGMYMPWAYDMKHLATRNAPAMMEVLKSLDQDHCKCPFGAAGKEVGYPCPGTCLDWVYDKLVTPYVFAFEIFTDSDRGQSLTERWKEKLEHGGSFLLQSGSHLGHEHFKTIFKEYESDFVQTNKSETDENVQSDESEESEVEDRDACFSMYNPGSKESYSDTVDNWSTVYLKMAQQLAKKIRNGDLQDSNSTEVVNASEPY